MSATNKTTYYELPVFIATDEPKWLTDWNGAMNIIDGAIAEAKTAADNAQKVNDYIAGKYLLIAVLHTVKSLTSYGNNCLELSVSCKLTAGHSRISLNYIKLTD